MSNVKEVIVEGEVEFSWLNGKEAEPVAALLARIYVHPNPSLEITMADLNKYIPNKFGGKTAIWEFQMIGIEAIAIPALEVIVTHIKKHGILKRALYRDIENRFNWIPIKPKEEK